MPGQSAAWRLRGNLYLIVALDILKLQCTSDLRIQQTVVTSEPLLSDFFKAVLAEVGAK